MSFFHRLRNTLRTGRLDQELDEEMRFHIDMRAEAYERQGVPREEARLLALRRFGSRLQIRDRVRDVRLLTWLDSVRQDLFLGVRLLRRSPALALAALASLGLALGAAVGVFAAGDALLMRPLPVQRPHELLVPQWRSTEWPDIGIWGSGDADFNSWSFSYPMYHDFAAMRSGDVAGFQELSGAITNIRGEAGTLDASLVTGSFFRVLGLAPAAGRLLAEHDDEPGAPPVVVLSHRLWQRSFGSDPAAIGTTMAVNGQAYTIVGVAPKTFFGMQPGRWSDAYLPSHWVSTVPQPGPESLLTSESLWWLQLVVRPRPGSDPRSVQAEMSRAFDLRVKPFITKPKQHAVFGLRDGARGYAFENAEAGRALRILAALVALVLLIACANVANLLLARAESRRREAAMRLALGAGGLRLARQHLTESMLLAMLAGLGGFVFARWFGEAVLALAPGQGAVDLRFGWRVAGFAAALSVLAGLAVGVGPAWRLSRAPVAAALKAGVTVRAGWGHRMRVGRPLVGLQIALSLLLLVVAGLFVRSLTNLQAAPLGFRTEGLMLFGLDPTAAGYGPEQKAAAIQRIAARLGGLPGVRAVTWSSFALLDNFSWNTAVTVPGMPKDAAPCNLLFVGPRFHEVLGIPLVAGRYLDARDGLGAPRAAVVNRAFVQRYLGGHAALGRQVAIDLDHKQQEFEIVGVVANTKYARIRRGDQPIAFLSVMQQAIGVGPTFVVATSGGRGTIAGEVRRVVHELEPSLPVMRIRTYEEQLAGQISMERSMSLVAAAFGGLALLLAGIGLYGVVAFAVARRTAEMGVRLALGASRSAVLRLILLDGARVIVPGALAGTAAALAATRLVRSVLYGLEPTDPATILASVLLLLSVAVVAAYVPARRAAAIDPVEALRCE